jgi:hypothetical protein
MKKILISCPYNRIQDLYESLNNIKKDCDLIFDGKDITAIDDDFVYIGKNSDKHKISSFTGAFIRYPYDLIEPHSSTYQKRESTEFLKTLALSLKDVSINSIQKSHFVRNRIYSLLCARECGLRTPKSIIYKSDKVKLDLGNYKFTKSLGNCYFSSHISEKENNLKKFLSFAEDGGETAYIYEPRIIKNKDHISEYLKNFGTLLLQDEIKGVEYRVFIVGKDVFIYQREKIDSLDKSSAGLIKSDIKALKGCENKLLKLSVGLGLDYLCLDIIIDKDPVVIDINPFGSFPKYKLHPEVVDSLARLVLAKKS